MTPNERTAERTFYAVRRREDLVRKLSPDLTCGICGGVFHLDQLHVDHVDGVRYDRALLSPHQRAAAYWKDYRAGEKMRALCWPCSGRDGNKFRGRPRYVKGMA